MESAEIVEKLKSLANKRNVEGMARFGINPRNTLGVSIPLLRRIARQQGKDHSLALQLWSTGIHEARILACMVDEPSRVTRAQLERWVRDFDCWDVCDQCCSNLIDKTAYAHELPARWSRSKQEFVKRAAFALIAALAVHDKKAKDSLFEGFIPLIKRASVDDRNFVKKAVNWALRQIGKRNKRLNRIAINTAREIARIDSRSARWIAADALRELEQRF